MRVLIHDTMTHCVAKAFTSLGHEVVGYLPSDDNGRISVAGELLSKAPAKVTVDIIATAAPFSRGREIKQLMLRCNAPYLLWDLGNTGMTRRVYAGSVTSLQIEGYDCTFLLDLDPTDYGLNLKTKHNFLIASAHKLDLKSAPPKSPFVRHTLDEILDSSKHFPVDVQTSMFGKVVGNKYIKKPPSHKYCGCAQIMVNSKTGHFLTPSEACAIVGFPIELEAEMIDVMFHKPLLVDMLMNEAPYDMWIDLINRTFGEANGN